VLQAALQFSRSRFQISFFDIQRAFVFPRCHPFLL
jgi:hypothetical protein